MLPLSKLSHIAVVRHYLLKKSWPLEYVSMVIVHDWDQKAVEIMHMLGELIACWHSSLHQSQDPNLHLSAKQHQITERSLKWSDCRYHSSFVTNINTKGANSSLTLMQCTKLCLHKKYSIIKKILNKYKHYCRDLLRPLQTSHAFTLNCGHVTTNRIMFRATYAGQ